MQPPELAQVLRVLLPQARAAEQPVRALLPALPLQELAPEP